MALIAAVVTWVRVPGYPVTFVCSLGQAFSCYLWSEFWKHFETDGTKAARSEQHMAALQNQYCEKPNHNPAALYRFVNNFVMHATYVRAYDFHWGNEQLLHHFKSVVCHESTQYLINLNGFPNNRKPSRLPRMVQSWSLPASLWRR